MLPVQCSVGPPPTSACLCGKTDTSPRRRPVWQRQRWQATNIKQETKYTTYHTGQEDKGKLLLWQGQATEGATEFSLCATKTTLSSRKCLTWRWDHQRQSVWLQYFSRAGWTIEQLPPPEPGPHRLSPETNWDAAEIINTKTETDWDGAKTPYVQDVQLSV